MREERENIPLPVQVTMIHGLVVMARSGPWAGPANRPVQFCGLIVIVQGLPPVYRGVAEGGPGAENPW